jgi:hypothetical protein
MVLFHLSYGLVGENHRVPHPSSPLRHDRLAGEGFHASILLLVMRQVEITHGDVQRVIESRFAVGNGPGKLILHPRDISVEMDNACGTRAFPPQRVIVRTPGEPWRGERLRDTVADLTPV